MQVTVGKEGHVQTTSVGKKVPTRDADGAVAVAAVAAQTVTAAGSAAAVQNAIIGTATTETETTGKVAGEATKTGEEAHETASVELHPAPAAPQALTVVRTALKLSPLRAFSAT